MTAGPGPASFVDPHIHLWDPYTVPREAAARARLLRPLPRLPRGLGRLATRADREFVGDPRAVLRPYLPTDYRDDLDGVPVDTVVHVEAAWPLRRPLDAVAETRWVRELPSGRAGAPRLGALLVHADPRDPDVGSVLDAHRTVDPRVRGVRLRAAAHPDDRVRDFADVPHLLRDPAFVRGVAAIAERDLVVDLWLYSHQLDDAVALVAEYPDTTFVLDHYATPVGVLGPRGRHTGATPAARRDLLARWRDGIAALAAAPNVVAKHSGLGMSLLGGEPVVGVDPAFVDRVAPLVRGLHESFGPDRTMWASNFPIDRPGQPLSASAQVLTEVLGGDARPDALFADVARRVYRLDVPTGPDDPPARSLPTRTEVRRFTLAGQVVLVTGAAGGIGSATARRLTHAGARVVWADLDAERTREAAAEAVPDDEPLCLALDVTSPASCAAAVQATLDHHGRLDVVWANAGVSAFGPLATVDPDTWRQVVEVNLLGSYHVARAALPALVAHRGYLAFTASWASFAHSPGHSAYAASKAGIEALADGLRSELDHEGVRVGVFHPGWIDTRMVTEKQRTQPAFGVLLDSLPGPLGALTPVDELAEVLADAIARRAAKVVHPRVGWALHAARALLPTRPFTASARAAAPEIRRLSGPAVPADPSAHDSPGSTT
ncbi:SDR family NAD(P)-dependent oxidoreductase [Actinomycetospora atypica]|uniref:SDR family NAD(P)-dependent oxidoreductase n=1 Tax=Actinomycetospora atypica TaxID=1290095 RepID=A0ABV9YGQ3_9PSEU